MLFSHVGGPDGCRPAGVRRVKGITGTKNGSWRRGHQYSGGWAGAPPDELGAPVGYADADGYEIVDAYQCVENCPVRLLDEQAGPRTSGGRTSKAGSTRPGLRGNTIVRPSDQVVPPSDGNCSRFFPTFPGADPDPEEAVPYFYTPKASRRDRGEGNNHSTVKPTALCRWLVRLLVKPGTASVVLDPFCGSGSVGVACVREGVSYIGIDCEPAYVAIARRRIVQERERQTGPLFANTAKDV